MINWTAEHTRTCVGLETRSTWRNEIPHKKMQYPREVDGMDWPLYDVIASYS